DERCNHRRRRGEFLSLLVIRQRHVASKHRRHDAGKAAMLQVGAYPPVVVARLREYPPGGGGVALGFVGPAFPAVARPLHGVSRPAIAKAWESVREGVAAVPHEVPRRLLARAVRETAIVAQETVAAHAFAARVIIAAATNGARVAARESLRRF